MKQPSQNHSMTYQESTKSRIDKKRPYWALYAYFGKY